MKKYRLSLLALSALLIASCDYNDKHFKGLDDMSTPHDTKGVEYVLEADDYKTIAKNKANIELVEQLDAALNATEGELETRTGEASGEGGVVEEVKPATPYKDALALVEKTGVFGEILPANDLIIPFVANKWAFKDANTAVKITYNQELERTALSKAMDHATEYSVSGEDYDAIWGGDIEAPYFTEAKPAKTFLPGILKGKIENPEEGAACIVNYKYSVLEPNAGGEPSPILFSSNFDDGFTIAASDWKETLIEGKRKWEVREYNGNSYLQYSSFRSNEKNEVILSTPSIKIKEGATFSFGVKLGNDNGNPLAVLIAEDADKPVWKDITSSFNIPAGPAKGYPDDFANSGAYSLNDYVGKRIVIGFKYTGNGIQAAEGVEVPKDAITTTVQIDNVVVSTEAPQTRALATRAAVPTLISDLSSLYVYEGGNWKLKEYDIVLSNEDYREMSVKDNKFADQVAAQNMIVKMLNRDFAFESVGRFKNVVYKVKHDVEGLSDFVVNRFDYDGTTWVYAPNQETETSQFVKFDMNVWKFDPSVYLELKVDRNDKAVSAFYQPITDWVWENIDVKELGITKKGEGYVTSHGNNDYYSGTSAYQNNVDLRLAKYKEQYAKGYEGKTDDEILEMVKGRWPNAFMIGLEVAYPDAKPVEGIDVIYTIKFGAYTGTDNLYFEIKYQVVGDGKFEYIEESLVQL